MINGNILDESNYNDVATHNKKHGPHVIPNIFVTAIPYKDFWDNFYSGNENVVELHKFLLTAFDISELPDQENYIYIMYQDGINPDFQLFIESHKTITVPDSILPIIRPFTKVVDIGTFNSIKSQLKPTMIKIWGKTITAEYTPDLWSNSSAVSLPITNIVGLNYLRELISQSFDILNNYTISEQSTINNHGFQQVLQAQGPIEEEKYKSKQVGDAVVGVAEKHPLYIAYLSLRDYIDMYHDFLDKGHVIADFIKTQLMNTYKDNINIMAIFNKWLPIIDSNILTKNKNVNQTQCKIILETIIDEFIGHLHTAGSTSIPRSNALSLKEVCDIGDVNNITNLLRSSEVKQFYVESAAGSVGKALQAAGLKNIDFPIGQWDGGTGFGKAGSAPSVGNTLMISPTPQTIYGLYHIQPVTLSQIQINAGGILIDIYGPQKLTLNKVAIKAGLGQIRGVSNESNDKTFPNIKFNGTDLPTLPAFVDGEDQGTTIIRGALASLKTWTDYIQVLASVEYDRNHIATGKSVSVYSDILCAKTARMHGQKFVLINQGKTVSLYSYDINAFQLSKDQLTYKIKIKLILLNSKDNIKKYITSWFKNRIERLNELIQIAPDPTIYFTSILYTNIYKLNYDKALGLIDNIENTPLQQFPNSINEYIENITEASSTLSSFLQQMNEFNEGIMKFTELPSTIKPEQYEEAYESLKKVIINTLISNDDSLINQTILAVMIYLVCLKPRPEIAAQSLFFLPGFKNIFESLAQPYKDYIKNIKNNVSVPTNPEMSFAKLLQRALSTPIGGRRKTRRAKRSVRRQQRRKLATRRRRASNNRRKTSRRK